MSTMDAVRIPTLHDYEEQLFVFPPEIRILSDFRTPISKSFHVKFSFICQPVFREWLWHQETGETLLFQEEWITSLTSSTELSLEEFADTTEAYQILNENQLLPPRWRRQITQAAYSQAKDFVKAMPPDRPSSVECCFDVMVLFERMINEDDEIMDFLIRQSMEEAANHLAMTPASNSSIESLKMVTVTSISSDHDHGGDCPICMEDLADQECASMPCSHVFHGGCIKKWRQTSHYCPLCRFQMPTS